MVAPAPSPTAMWHPGHGAPTPKTRPFRFGDACGDGDPILPAQALVGGRYRIVRELGQGGMGRVYEAEHLGLGAHVAVKVLRGDRNSGEHLARFRQEAEAASRIGHRAIVAVSDFGIDGDRPYMVMELLTGSPLEDWLSQPGRLDDGLAWLAEICRGLAAAHAVGVVHRDVKPGNVFLHRQLDGELQVKLLDFGIAKVASTDHTAIATSAGTVLGTPYYLAPERALGRPLDPRADLYSVGVMLYEMLTGTVPFVDDTFVGVLTKHVRELPLDPRQAAPERGIPDAVARLAMRLLAKQPAERGADAAALAVEIDELRVAERAAIAEVITGPRSLGRAGEATVDLDALADRPTTAPTDEPRIEARVAPRVAAVPAIVGAPESVARTRALGSNAMADVGPPAPARARPIAWWVPPAIAAGLLLVAWGAWTVAPQRATATADEPAATADAERPAAVAAPVATTPAPRRAGAPAPAITPPPTPPAAIDDVPPATVRKPVARPRTKPRTKAPTPPVGDPKPGASRPPPLK